jgi:hypothetical protein
MPVSGTVCAKKLRVGETSSAATYRAAITTHNPATMVKRGASRPPRPHHQLQAARDECGQGDGARVGHRTG